MRRLRTFAIAAGLTVAAGLVSCTEGTAPMESPDPTGTYTATRFTIVFQGDTIDELGQGVTLSLTLSADSSTTGTLFVPVAGNGPATLIGRWSRSGTSVTFSQTPESFLDHLTFAFAGDELYATGTVGPGDFSVTLTR